LEFRGRPLFPRNAPRPAGNRVRARVGISEAGCASHLPTGRPGLDEGENGGGRRVSRLSAKRGDRRPRRPRPKALFPERGGGGGARRVRQAMGEQGAEILGPRDIADVVPGIRPPVPEATRSKEVQEAWGAPGGEKTVRAGGVWPGLAGDGLQPRGRGGAEVGPGKSGQGGGLRGGLEALRRAGKGGAGGGALRPFVAHGGDPGAAQTGGGWRGQLLRSGSNGGAPSRFSNAAPGAASPENVDPPLRGPRSCGVAIGGGFCGAHASRTPAGLFLKRRCCGRRLRGPFGPVKPGGKGKTPITADPAPLFYRRPVQVRADGPASSGSVCGEKEKTGWR